MKQNSGEGLGETIGWRVGPNTEPPEEKQANEIVPLPPEELVRHFVNTPTYSSGAEQASTRVPTRQARVPAPRFDTRWYL
ncbi:hypothetical protein SBA4_7080005 [Candidatus Sulfopaludibacter sp. SbA4]|nr:hypothetical protein SBA4_7080005 [Candidatus Sulfopaludibacter sp. SbA4]